MTRFTIACLMALLLSPAAFAQELGNHNSKQPIDISADNLEVQQDQQKAIFTGNVLAKQGTLTIKSDRMTVYYTNQEKKSANSGMSKLEVTGNVFLATPTETASGSSGVYDVAAKNITLVDNVVLTRGKNVLKGSRLDYNLTTGRSVIKSATATGEKSGGRVRALFVPEEKSGEPEKKKEKEAP